MEGVGIFVTILKLFLNLLSGNLYLPSENSSTTNTPSEPETLHKAGEEVFIPEAWIFDDLLAIAKVGIPKRQELRELGVNSSLWVANLLFAYSPSQSPQSPLGLAIANLTKLQRYPDDDFEFLAKIPPGELAALLFWELDAYRYVRPTQIPPAWKRTMENTPTDRLRMLIAALFRNLN